MTVQSVRIDRLSLRLPAGFEARAAAIGRLVAADLAQVLRERRPPAGWAPGPVHVQASPSDPDAAVARRIAAGVAEGWR